MPSSAYLRISRYISAYLPPRAHAGTYKIAVELKIAATVKLIVSTDKNLPGNSGELPPVQMSFAIDAAVSAAKQEAAATAAAAASEEALLLAAKPKKAPKTAPRAPKTASAAPNTALAARPKGEWTKVRNVMKAVAGMAHAAHEVSEGAALKEAALEEAALKGAAPSLLSVTMSAAA